MSAAGMIGMLYVLLFSVQRFNFIFLKLMIVIVAADGCIIKAGVIVTACYL